MPAAFLIPDQIISTKISSAGKGVSRTARSAIQNITRHVAQLFIIQSTLKLLLCLFTRKMNVIYITVGWATIAWMFTHIISMEQKIRNAKIRVSWDVMGRFTELKYKDKIQALMKEYYLSYGRIEDIIQKDFGEEEG